MLLMCKDMYKLTHINTYTVFISTYNRWYALPQVLRKAAARLGGSARKHIPGIRFKVGKHRCYKAIPGPGVDQRQADKGFD